MKIVLWLTSLLSLVPTSALATPTMQPEQKIRTTFVTPPHPMGQALCGRDHARPVLQRLLNTQAREIVGLMQRFDIQADAAYWYHDEKMESDPNFPNFPNFHHQFPIR